MKILKLSGFLGLIAIVMACNSQTTENKSNVSDTSTTVETVNIGTIDTQDTTANKIYDYTSLEVKPTPAGGLDGFRKYLAENIKYPVAAKENKLQGIVYVNFTVEKDGSITDVAVDRKLGGGLDEEAIRVIKASDKWSPGMQNGEPVRVKYNVPVNFAL